MEKTKEESSGTKLVNKILIKLYFLSWIPLRFILYGLIGIHAYFYYYLYKEELEGFSNILKFAMGIIGMLLVAQLFILMHFVIYKRASVRITQPRFLELEKRFTKDQLNTFSPELKKLLSYSHGTEDDLKKFLNTGEREHERKDGKICNEIKIYSMGHCKSCNRCVFRYDHHCPWFNTGIGIHNINYYCSFLVYATILIFVNLFSFIFFRYSETYNMHYIIYRLCIIINFLCIYFVGGLTLAFLIFVGNGRALSEIFLELIADPFPPKYKIYTNWRENLFTIFGTWHYITAIFIPYLFGPAITGLEFGFLSGNRDPDDFFGEILRNMRNWWYEGEVQFTKI